MTQVWERLYLGSWIDASGLAKANPHRITTVISVCEQPVVRRNRTINYVHLPIEDEKPVAVGQFDAVIDAIGENVRWGTVLVNCGSGISRAPVTVAAWMHVCGYKSIDAALREIVKLRPMIAPSEILLSSVKEHLR